MPDIIVPEGKTLDRVYEITVGHKENAKKHTARLVGYSEYQADFEDVKSGLKIGIGRVPGQSIDEQFGKPVK